MDLSSASSLVGASAAVVGLPLVWRQVHSGSAAARAAATIQFQERFKESREHRIWTKKHFPVHESLTGRLDPPDADVRTWSDVSELTLDERRSAQFVIAAINDVAQYVADGLELRSALQQYHTIFVQLGVLLQPYLVELNRCDAERRPPRYGRRIPILTNAAIAYHRCSPKHREKDLYIERDAMTIRLLDRTTGLPQFPGFEDYDDKLGECVIKERIALRSGRSVTRTIKDAQALLRR